MAAIPSPTVKLQSLKKDLQVKSNQRQQWDRSLTGRSTVHLQRYACSDTPITPIIDISWLPFIL